MVALFENMLNQTKNISIYLYREVFSLDYSMDSPLNAVVSAEALAKYRICFHMLWRLKRVEWTLALAWKQIASFERSNGREKERDRDDAAHLSTLRCVYFYTQVILMTVILLLLLW